MHIPDGYLGPQTYGLLYAVMVPLWALASRFVRRTLKQSQVPFLALGAAFSFVVMMFNIPIKAGHVIRTVQPGGSAYTVFRVGEVHGRITPRAQELAQMLCAVDSAKVTTNLWGERWSKLTQNSMVNGISACTGMNSKAMVGWERSRRVSIRLAGEAVRIGHALGYELESIRGLPPERWVAAAGDEPAEMEAVESVMLGAMKRMTDEGRPSTGQDILKGRRTEIDFINGLVAAKGEEVGIPAPTNAALTQLVKRVERGEIEANPRNIETL